MTESNPLPPLNEEVDLEIVRFIDALAQVAANLKQSPV